jgi:hypothetical protein
MRLERYLSLALASPGELGLTSEDTGRVGEQEPRDVLGDILVS